MKGKNEWRRRSRLKQRLWRRKSASLAEADIVAAAAAAVARRPHHDSKSMDDDDDAVAGYDERRAAVEEKQPSMKVGRSVSHKQATSE